MPIDKSVVEREPTNSPKPKMRTNHLLIIGIDQYANGIMPLNNAVRDAKQFKELVVEKFQFEEKNIAELYNHEATRSNILQTFGQLLNELGEKDNLVFYYSGHGEQLKVGTGELGYWIPSDATYEKSWTYIPNSEIINLFKLSKAHHIFGIVDSCFSGSLFATRQVSTAVERIDSYPSRWLLTAGRLEAVSDGSLGANSPFATSLFTYLKNTPGEAIWVADLCSWVLKGMSFNTEKQTPRGEPLQDVGHFGGQFVFYKKGYVPALTEKTTSTKNPKEEQKDRSVKRSDILGITASKELPILKNVEDVKTYLNDLKINNLEKALNTFRSISTENQIVHQLGRYNRNKDDFEEGITRLDDRNRENNKISQALSSMIEKLTEDSLVPNYLSVLMPPKNMEYQNSTISPDLSELATLEQNGLQEQAATIVKNLNKLKQALILETDASRQFAYEEQIMDWEMQLEKIKEQME